MSVTSKWHPCILTEYEGAQYKYALFIFNDNSVILYAVSGLSPQHTDVIYELHLVLWCRTGCVACTMSQTSKRRKEAQCPWPWPLIQLHRDLLVMCLTHSFLCAYRLYYTHSFFLFFFLSFKHTCTNTHTKSQQHFWAEQCWQWPNSTVSISRWVSALQELHSFLLSVITTTECSSCCWFLSAPAGQKDLYQTRLQLPLL